MTVKSKNNKDLWILVRGLGREAGHWFQFAKILEEQLGPIDTLYLDLPGCGIRHRESSPTNMTEITDLVQAEFQERKIDTEHRKVFIIGMSLGGMVAIDWMQRYPHDLSGVVLINTSLRIFSPSRRRLNPLAFLKGVFAMRGQTHRKRELAFLNLSTNDPLIRKKFRGPWLEIQSKQPVSNNTILRQLFAASRFSPEQKKPHVPILVLCSGHDKIVNPNCSEDICKSWDLPMERHDSAGHDVCLEQGEWVSEKIKKFIPKIS